MKHILQVLKFEYLTCVKNKAFIITTILILAAILLSSIIPTIIMSAGKSDDKNKQQEAPVICIQNKVYDNKQITELFKAVYPEHAIYVSDEDISTVKAKVNTDKYIFAVLIDDELSYTFVTKNNSLMNSETSIISTVLINAYRMNKFSEKGVSPADTQKILSADAKYITITTGTDQTKNYISTYILMMILYIAIMMYGQMVSQSVVSEKNTRAMEMLITCAKPSHLMFGKVLGSGLAGLTQLLLIIGTAIVSIQSIAANTLPKDITEMLSLPVKTAVFAVIFFILGYFIYAFLLGALSSFASRSEDLNTLTTPIMMLYFIAFIIVIICMNSDSLDSTLMIVCQYIPFTAPVAMFARIALSNPATYEIIISTVIQALSVYLFGLFASQVYRMGVLMYGKPPRITEILKMLKEQHKNNKGVSA